MDIKKVLKVEELDIDKIDTEAYDVYPSRTIGRCEKMFLRVRSDSIKDFVKDIYTENENSYITYVSELINSGYVPRRISALCKDVSERLDDEDDSRLKGASSEVLSSQIMNYFGCPTVYNKLVKGELEGETRYSVMSIDFMSEGDELVTFDQLNCRFVGFYLAVRSVKGAMEQYGNEYPKEEIDSVVEDFAYSYLVRKVFLGDFDFIPVNIGVIENEKNKTLNLINFDYEGSFNGKYVFANHDLICCQKMFPKVYNKFYDKFKKLYDGMELLRANGELDVYSMGCISNYEHLLDVMDYLYDFYNPNISK